jgi:hypothetical protein
MKLKKFDPKDFKVDDKEFLCRSKIYRSYVDPKSNVSIF